MTSRAHTLLSAEILFDVGKVLYYTFPRLMLYYKSGIRVKERVSKVCCLKNTLKFVHLRQTAHDLLGLTISTLSGLKQ